MTDSGQSDCELSISQPTGEFVFERLPDGTFKLREWNDGGAWVVFDADAAAVLIRWLQGSLDDA